MIILDEKTLFREYRLLRKSMSFIAREYNTTIGKVQYKMIKLGIPRYSKSNAKKGIKHSKEPIDNIRQAQKGNKYRLGVKCSLKTRKRMSISKSGPNHPWFGKKRPKQSIRMKGQGNPMFGKHHTEETKRKIRKNHADVGGKNNPHFGRPASNGKRVKYSNIFFRSSWEAKYAKWLDVQKIDWKYESKTFDLGDWTYTPDFYLPKTNEYIEIKGWWRGNARLKVYLFRQKYPDISFQVLEKKELSGKGVI